MIYIIIVILIIAYILYSILEKKNLLHVKLNAKTILLIFVICILIFGLKKILKKRHDIVFFFQSLEYENIDDYDYSNDIANQGYISKEGAIKIAKEKTNSKRIANVNCELVENGTYINYEEQLNNLLKQNTQENVKKQATYWLISLTTGWDYLCGHAEVWYFKIDYYTGEILQYDVTN